MSCDSPYSKISEDVRKIELINLDIQMGMLHGLGFNKQQR